MGVSGVSPAMESASFARSPSNSSQTYSPGQLLVGDVSIDLTWKNHKTLSAFDLISIRMAGRIIGQQCSGAGYDIMEQKMGTCSRTK